MDTYIMTNSFNTFAMAKHELYYPKNWKPLFMTYFLVKNKDSNWDPSSIFNDIPCLGLSFTGHRAVNGLLHRSPLLALTYIPLHFTLYGCGNWCSALYISIRRDHNPFLIKQTLKTKHHNIPTVKTCTIYNRKNEETITWVEQLLNPNDKTQTCSNKSTTYYQGLTEPHWQFS